MTKTKIDEILKLEDTISKNIIEYQYMYDNNFIDDVFRYMSLMREYCMECDERLMWYEDFICSIFPTQSNGDNIKINDKI